MAKKLAADYTHLTGDVLLSAGCIAYLGPFTAAYRERAINQWVERCRCGLANKPLLVFCNCLFSTSMELSSVHKHLVVVCMQSGIPCLQYSVCAVVLPLL